MRESADLLHVFLCPSQHHCLDLFNNLCNGSIPGLALSYWFDSGLREKSKRVEDGEKERERERERERKREREGAREKERERGSERERERGSDRERL